MISHSPVMLAEMLDWLRPQDKEIYIDGTFGAGGYSRAILAAADCQVFAIDRDPSTKRFAETLESEFPGRFVWILGNFADMCALVAMHGVRQVDGVVLDLGVSSMQLDQADRGFSFRKDGPLDMRMGDGGLSAADVVNEASESELADILYYYGEEKAARAIAKAIVSERTKAPIERTQQLAAIIRGVLGGKHAKSDPATRSFQALRIHINQEFESIERGLAAAGSLLSPGGRLVVVTFHSLEDRLVKRHYHSRCGRLGEPSRHVPMHAAANEAPHFFLPRPEKRSASDAELEVNPRARSATMRMMQRVREAVL
ncbi:MAG: 16S rRNA (cytosine(1402)-N(4))-methyltransferase RsmH [Rickettsiales bacterium]|jgi:16S rRNA (cytosine1402-N4)-methyltransferase|nr:16S rRNA (cytosine(1402)-N(4))-methyltransferase RsmH [Rickettsiales bacterium]